MTPEIHPWAETAWTRYVQRLNSGALPHALLMTGQAGLGMQEFVSAVCASLLCSQPNAGFACRQCRSCQLLSTSTHPDFWQAGLVDDKKSIGVYQIRELSQSLAMRPQLGARQVALINPADALTVQAANALLKTLEEPSADTVLLLISERPGNLLSTIISRCQRMSIQTPMHEAALTWLKARAPATTPIDDLRLSLQLAAGAPLAALGLLTGIGLTQYRQLAQALTQPLAGQEIALARQFVDDAAQFSRFYQLLNVERARELASNGSADDRLAAMGTLNQQAARIADLVGTGVRIDLAIAELLRQHRGIFQANRRKAHV